MTIDHGFNGTSLLVAFDPKNIEKDIQDGIEKIIDLKKQPFSKIFVQIPEYAFELFFEKSKQKDLKIKSIDRTRPIFLIAY